MADQRLRELERRFLETGDAGDETAYLAHGVRTGAIPRDRVAIACWLGHPPARAALDGEGAPPPDDEREIWIRVAFHPVEDAVFDCFPRMPDKDRYPGPPRRVLQAARAWLRSPNDATEAAAGYVARDFWSDPKGFPFGSEPTFYLALHAAYHLGRAIQAPPEPDPEREAAARAEHEQYAEFLRGRGRPAPDYVAFATRPEAEQALRYAHRALVELCGLDPAAAAERLRAAQLRYTVPWLLGRWDPIRERASAPRGAEERLRAAEARAAAAPDDLAGIERWVAACDELGWTWDGRTLGEWRAQVCGNWNLAKVAIERIAPLGPRAVPAALAALESDGYQTPGFGVSLLRELGTDARAAVPTLLRLLADRETRGNSGPSSWIHLLGRTRSTDAIGPLVEVLGDGRLGSDAGQALLRIGAPATDALREVLTRGGANADDLSVRLAAFVLAELRAPGERVVPILARVLGWHPWNSHRAAALHGLRTLGRAEEHLDLILSWLRDELDEYERYTPVLALGALGLAPTTPRVREALAPFLQHESRRLRACVEAALAGRPVEPWRHPFWLLD